METETLDAAPVRPLLFRTATPRVPGVEIPGSYDSALRVWAVDAGGVRQPIIIADEDALLDITTSTRVRQEADDEEIVANTSLTRLAEIVTKTAVVQEADDERIDGGASIGLLGEIATKTEAEQESDDEQVGAARALGLLAEIVTKTDVQQESDDQIEAVGMAFDLRSISGRRGMSLPEVETKTFVDIEHDDQDEGLI